MYYSAGGCWEKGRSYAWVRAGGNLCTSLSILLASKSALKNRVLVSVKVKRSLSRVWLCDPVDYTIHGVLQARILQWVAFPFSRRSSQSRDRTQVSLIAGGFFTNWAPREAPQWFLIVVLLFGLYKKDLFPLLKLIDNSTAKSVEHKINSKLQNK